MQISSHLPILYSPVKMPDEPGIRLPVLLDKPTENKPYQATLVSRPVTDVIESTDSQQGRFIRNFSVTNQPYEQQDNGHRLSPYLQAEALRDQPIQERIFDAMA